MNITLTFGESDVDRIIDALRSSKGDQMADPLDIRLARTIASALRDARADEQERRANTARIEARLAERAANHVLTRRQAEALAAVRAGKDARYKPQFWMGRMEWRHTRSMGGAVRRMIETLMAEGLLGRHGTPQVGKLTAAGEARLAAYEAKHGRIGPE